MPEDLPLEPDLIKVLASDTRRDILRQLQNRNMTVTELARELELGKATIHEHLNKLSKADLVQRQEDDRLWVYYQLSPQGKRVLNPQRTRFYLVVAVSVLAGIAAVLAVALFLQTTGPVDPFTDRPEAQAGLQAFHVQVPDDQIYASDGLALEATVSGPAGTSGDLDAYLVPADEAGALKDGSLDASGYRLSVEHVASMGAAADTSTTEESASRTATDGPALVQLSTGSQLPPGQYVLFVRSGLDTYAESGFTLDNRQTMPLLQVSRIDTDLSATTWYQGLSPALTVELAQEGQALDGLLTLRPVPAVGQGQPGLTVEVSQGTALVPANALDQASPGRYQLVFSPEDGDRWRTLDAEVTLQRPQAVVSETHLLADQAHSLEVTIRPAQAIPEAGLPIDVKGATITEERTLEDGALISLAPPSPGQIELSIGRLATQTLTVHPNLGTQIAVLDGPQWELALADAHGRPAANHTVHLDGQLVGLTNSTGNLTMEVPDEGLHSLSLRTPEGSALTRVIRVDGWTPSAAAPELRLQATTPSTLGQQTSFSVQVDNPTTTPTSATLRVHLDDRPAATQALHLEPGGNSTTALDLPVEAPGQHQLVVQATPLQTGPLIVENRTTSSDDGASDGGSGGGGGIASDEPADGDDGSTDAAMAGSSQPAGAQQVLTFEVLGSATEQATRLQQPAQAEPVLGAGADQMAESAPAAETPLPASLAVVAILAAVLVARARRARR